MKNEEFDKLKEYKEKRDFKITAEPEGNVRSDSGKNHYVIQKHDASQLHYDFRIAVDGVLISWVIPKGPSLDKSDKRLAVRTEDHPLEYANFEGVIPKEEYGGGTVLIWDKGTFENITEKDDKIKDLAKAISDGHFMIRIKGKKLKGGYAMTRIKQQKNSEQWLFVKMDDEYADGRRNPVSSEPDSVISGDSIEEVRKKAEKK